MREWRQYRQFEKGEMILCAVDTCAGLGDFTTAQFLSKNKIDVPLVFQSQVTTSDFLPKLSEVLEKIFDKTEVKPVIAIERNNGGVFLLDRLGGMNFKNKYEIFKMPRPGNINEAEPVKLGWETSTASRPLMLQSLKDAIDRRVLTIYDLPTIEEMFSFVVVRTTSIVKAQAEQGSHDDLVMSLAIAWQLYQNCNYEAQGNDIIIPDDTTMFKEGGFY